VCVDVCCVCMGVCCVYGCVCVCVCVCVGVGWWGGGDGYTGVKEKLKSNLTARVINVVFFFELVFSSFFRSLSVLIPPTHTQQLQRALYSDGKPHEFLQCPIQRRPPPLRTRYYIVGAKLTRWRHGSRPHLVPLDLHLLCPRVHQPL
jgi:hypothetical protein